MKKYIAPEIKAYNVSTQAMLAGSGDDPTVSNSYATEGSEGLSKSASSWIDDEE